MSKHPSRRPLQAIAWLLLAVAVTGVVRIVGRPGDSPAPDSQPEPRAASIRHRETKRIDDTESSQQAIEALLARRPGTERDSTLRQTVGNWVEATPDAALSWLKQLDRGEDRNWLMSAAAVSLVDHDAVKAAAIFELELPPGLARNHALVAIAQRWVQLAPDEARSWVESLEPGPAKEEALTEIEKISEVLSASAAE